MPLELLKLLEIFEKLEIFLSILNKPNNDSKESISIAANGAAETILALFNSIKEFYAKADLFTIKQEDTIISGIEFINKLYGLLLARSILKASLYNSSNKNQMEAITDCLFNDEYQDELKLLLEAFSKDLTHGRK